MTNKQRFETLYLLEASQEELMYMNEANRLTKEYNKKQKEYQSTVKRADADTEKQKHKIEKYKQLVKGSRGFSNGSIKNNTMIRAMELSDKKIDENEKDKNRAKYMSKSKGLNRDVLYKDKETSLSNGRKAAKEIAKKRDNGYKEYLSWKAQMRDAKKEGNLAKIKKLKENMPEVKSEYRDGNSISSKVSKDSKSKYHEIDDIKTKAKEHGKDMKDKQTKFKDQNGKRRSYTRDDLEMRDEKKKPGNTLDLQKKMKDIDEDIAFKKSYGMYKPTGGTDRAISNNPSKQKEKELNDKFKKDRKEFIRRLDIRISHNSEVGINREKEISKFEKNWWDKHI